MGVSQAKLLSIQIIVFFLLVSPLLAELTVTDIPSGSGSCCIPSYGDVVFFDASQATEAQAYCSDRGFVFVDSCYADGAATDPTLFESGYCCREIAGSSSVYSSDMSKAYCEAAGYQFNGDQPTCGGTYHTVYGEIFNSQTDEPLSGITIKADGVSVASDENGQFDFSAHYFLEGTYDFSVLVPASYSLDCKQDLVLTRTVNEDNFYINVQLSCSERTIPIDTCEAEWVVNIDGTQVSLVQADALYDGGYGECQSYGALGWLRERAIKNTNTNCTYTGEVPTRYTEVGCEDYVTVDGCNDGTLSTGELCDGTSFFFNEITQTGLSCSQALGAGYKGSVTCSSGCFFDFSSCQSTCDCSTADQCTNECQDVCQEEDICQSCEDALRFIPKAGVTHSSDDIFKLYSDLEKYEDASLFPEAPIEYHLGTKDVTLRWNFDDRSVCASDLLGFDVMVCKGSGGSCDPDGPIYTESLNGVNYESEYMFNDILEPDATFCYNIVARMQSGNDISAFEEGSYVCFGTGDSYCLTEQQEGKNCMDLKTGDGYGPTSCELYSTTTRTNLKASTTSCDGKACIETNYDPASKLPQDSGAYCVEQQLCESCNGIFGLFATYNLPALNSNLFSDYSCSQLLFKAEDKATIPGYSGTIQQGQCYLDESPTLFSFYDECSQVTSCYDYKSQGTCSSDPCYKFTEGDVSSSGKLNNPQVGCEWIPYNEEVGVGICRPTQPEKQDCSKCDFDSPIGYCSTELCNLYAQSEGDVPSCYLQEEIDPTYQSQAYFGDTPSCINTYDYSCLLYSTENDCTGGELPQINVAYDPDVENNVESNDYLLATDRIAGNNKQTYFSNDPFDLGDCRWNADQNRCYKDSNQFTGSLERDDCDSDGRALDSNCFKDITPPNTTLFLDDSADEIWYGAQELKDLSFGVSDDYSAPEEVNTYVSLLGEHCFADGQVPCDVEGVDGSCIAGLSELDYDAIDQAYLDGCFIYPQYTLADLADQDLLGTMLSGDGIYRVLYFSEDKARNLEELKLSKPIHVDDTKPEITISEPEKTVHEIYEDTYLTDTRFTVSVTETSTCQATLTSYGAKVGFETNYFSASPGENILLNYPQLNDGSYTLTVVCKDLLSNDQTAEKPFSINEDASITPLTPLGEVFLGDASINLQINTLYKGTCTYSFENKDHDFVYRESDATGHLYSQSLTAPSENGVYRLPISCNFETGKSTSGKPGDILVFAIDHVAPIGGLQEGKENFTDGTTEWKSSRDFTLTCNDATSTTPFGNNFGCEAIYYCVVPFLKSTSFDTTSFKDNPASTCSLVGGTYAKISQTDDYAETLQTTLRLGLESEYTFLYFFFEDRGGTKSPVQAINTKIRDNTIVIPTVEVG
ncbi:MAG: hypothetical protein KC535_00530 [Nanoarchaeota archaeon]|nr:hypothetical protein [Nanoarchaeota archaeon]